MTACTYCDQPDAPFTVTEAETGDTYNACDPCLSFMAGQDRRRGRMAIDFSDRRAAHSDEPIVRE